LPRHQQVHGHRQEHTRRESEATDEQGAGRDGFGSLAVGAGVLGGRGACQVCVIRLAGHLVLFIGAGDVTGHTTCPHGPWPVNSWRGQNASGGSSRPRRGPPALRARRAATPARSASASSRERRGSIRSTARARTSGSGPSRSTGPSTSVASGSWVVSRKE